MRKPIALKSEYILPVHELFAQSPARVQKIKGAAHEIVVKNRTSSTQSWLYGTDTVEPGAVMRLWVRPADCSFALTQRLTCDEFRACIDQTRIGALGHSSGGTTALALGGATLDYAALEAGPLPNSGRLGPPPLFELRRVREPSKVAP